jgi:hypothetical protein
MVAKGVPDLRVGILIPWRTRHAARALLRWFDVIMPLPPRSTNDQFLRGQNKSGALPWLLLLAAVVTFVCGVMFRYQLRNAAFVLCFIIGVVAGRVLVVDGLLRAFARRSGGPAANPSMRGRAVTKS